MFFYRHNSIYVVNKILSLYCHNSIYVVNKILSTFKIAKYSMKNYHTIT